MNENENNWQRGSIQHLAHQRALAEVEQKTLFNARIRIQSLLDKYQKEYSKKLLEDNLENGMKLSNELNKIVGKISALTEAIELL